MIRTAVVGNRRICLYHLIVLLVERGVTLEEIAEELKKAGTEPAQEALERTMQIMQPSLEEVKKLQVAGKRHSGLQVGDRGFPDAGFCVSEAGEGSIARIPARERRRRRDGLRAIPFSAAIHFSSRAIANGQPADFMQNLRATMARFKSVKLPNLPPFTGGAVGYFGYDMVRTIEDIPQTGVDDLGVDDAVLMFYKTVLAFDHLRHQIHIISNILVDESHESDRRPVRRSCRGNSANRSAAARSLEIPPVTRNESDVAVRSNFEKKRLSRQLSRKRRNTSRRATFSRSCCRSDSKWICRRSPFEIYRALRIVNPSPYMYFLKMPDTSHRRLIAGNAGDDPRPRSRIPADCRNAPRGANDAEDEANAERLRNDEKERAEHIMLVDLGRNDLGRVSQVRHGASRRSDVHRTLLARHASGVFAARGTCARTSTAGTR